MKPTTQPFKDGIVKIYKVTNIATAGNMPKDGLVIKNNLRYNERTVGMGRFWTAMQAPVKVEQLLRLPRLSTISTQDIAVPNDGEQYKIIQIQYPQDVEPPCMDLSLERVDSDYEIK